MSRARWCFALASEAAWSPMPLPEGVQVMLHVDRESRRMYPIWLEVHVDADLYAPCRADGTDNAAAFTTNAPHLEALLSSIAAISEECIGFEAPDHKLMIGPTGFHPPTNCPRCC